VAVGSKASVPAQKRQTLSGAGRQADAPRLPRASFHVGVTPSGGAERPPGRPYHDAPGVEEEGLTTQDLLEKWRDATRAAELAERLASLAAESAARADQTSAGAEEIARMAERAARAAERAASSARKAADRAATFARENRLGMLADADETVVATRAEELRARDRYHEAEHEARTRHG
jgi:hypothetical protein